MAAQRGAPEQVLEGKVALVTGAGRGIGLTAAQAFLRAGAQVAVIDREAGRLAAATKELAGEGHEPLALEADIRFEDAVDQAVGTALQHFGRIDVLFNNAALLMTFIKGDAAERPKFWEIEPTRWRELWDVNMTGTWLCCRRVAPEMMHAGRGSIINMITSYHTMRSEVHIPYGPSKAAIQCFTEAAAKQLRPHGVRVNALLPGQSVNPRGGSDPNLAASDVIVPAALYLASDESSRVTGASIIADEFNRERGLLHPGSPRAD